MYLFELLKQRSDFHFILKASFLEIYNEKVCLLVTVLLNAKIGAHFSNSSSTLHFRLLQLFSKYQLNAQFFYSSTIYMLHYAPQQVSSSTLLIIRRTNCITTASGIVTLEIGELSYINKMRSAVLLKQY